MRLYSKYLQRGNKIKMEVEVIPSYLVFEGIITAIKNGYIIVNISGEYIQKDEQRVRCGIVHEGKVCTFSTNIKGFVSGKLVLEEPLPEDVKILQRRKFIRVATDFSVDCFLVGFNNKTIDSNKKFPATIKNISGGGVLINTPLSLPVDTILVFELVLEGQLFILTVRVLRNEENSDGSRDLGCEFIGITEGDRQKIIAYTNRMQFKR